MRIAYDDVRPVYITSNAITLVPRVVGSPDVWAVTPDLPAGVMLDVNTGVIDGTPAAESAPTLYTITADAASTQIRLRFAEGYIVNDTGDGVDATPGDRICEAATGTGTCTLRAAVGEINADGGDHSVISIEPLTIILGSMLPSAMLDIELVGCSADTTFVDSNAVAPLIEFGNGDVTLTLSHLTYRNGLGPIIHNFQSNLRLAIEHAVVRDSSSLVNLPGGAELHIRDSWFEGNTGNPVYFSGATATIERSTFANNTGNTDGTLYFVYGTVAISDSTFSGNAGDSSAIVLNNATAVLVNNTFANNSSTTAFMGGAVTGYSNSTSTWSNNLLFANTGTSDQCHFNGALTSNGGNLVFPADDAGTTCQFDAVTDHASVDPLLEPLAANGAKIPIHALAADSPAVDSGVAAGCTPTDGRGVSRPRGTGCDIGAFERD